jgi:tetratricopeptide (TPR) repeat protein
MPAVMAHPHPTTIGALMLAWAALLSAPVRADEPRKSEQAVVEARRLIKVELRYAAAIELLEPALSDLELPQPLRIEAYELLAQASIAKGSIEKAEAAYASLLELSPDHQLSPTVSPKIREVFERVKKRGTRPLRLSGLSVDVSTHRLAFSGTLEDPSARVSGVDLYIREAGESSFRETPMEIDGESVKAVLESDIRRGTRVDYYVIARGKSGEPLARVGGPESPSSVLVELAQPDPATERITSEAKAEPPAEPSLFERWWFWAAIGGVVLTGIGAAYLIGHHRSEAPPGTLDPLHLP